MDRIFYCTHGTQLMVIQHLRRHIPGTGREFLIWSPLNDIPWVDRFMRSVIAGAGFADTLDIRDLEFRKPRTHGSAAWLVEAPRRLRRDAAVLRSWLKQNRVEEDEVELWGDDPHQSNGYLLTGVLQNARHVKYPHCFNFEDAVAHAASDWLVKHYEQARWTKRWMFWPWLRWASGVDPRPNRVVYERAYTFNLPSLWAKNSVDVSNLISMQAFDDTYRALSPSLRLETERQLRPIQGGPKPLILLLLIDLSLDGRVRQAYQRAVTRLFAERGSQLKGATLAVKAHPSARGNEEARLIAWLERNVPAKVVVIDSALNLEFMLPQLNPDQVWAGPCGSLPILKKLGKGGSAALTEVTEALCHALPTYAEGLRQTVEEAEVV